MDTHELPCRLKSARAKKRLVKADRDKQLIGLSKRRSILRAQQRALPLVELEKPYQKGWKRYFVLREDFRAGTLAEFYTNLLAKINTVEYHYDKTFKKKKRRKGRYGYEIRKQNLRELSPYSWNCSRLNLSEQEKACFTQVETFDIKTRRQEIKYVITEPWRYVLKIAPHMITHKKMVDNDIERELDDIARYIRNYDLAPRIDRLIRGRGYSYAWHTSLIKYGARTKRIPQFQTADDYIDLY